MEGKKEEKNDGRIRGRKEKRRKKSDIVVVGRFEYSFPISINWWHLNKKF